MMLDVIGKEGFNHNFDALEEANGRPSEFNKAFTELLHSPQASRYALARLVQSMIPVLSSLPAPWRAPRNARTKMDIMANEIVMESKANAKLDEMLTMGLAGLEAKRDLVSILVKVNMSPSLPESQRLTHTEVIAQIPTFSVAGHETTSIATVWVFHTPLQHPAVQAKLRQPLPPSLPTTHPWKNPTPPPSYPETEGGVVRRVSRWLGPYAPTVLTQRMATEDNTAALLKPYIDEAGKSDDSLLIPKGQIIRIQPILAVNTDKEVWGEDVREFKLKALLFTLICAFEFEAAMLKGGIRPRMSGVTGILQPPVVLGEEEKGSTLPLIVRPYITQ
ncbi:cytochrome P450 [Mycena olivaceomarginata]|nr:cytochrome P450 [Mycena olivaceomarginata]